MDVTVTDVPTRSRYEAREDGSLAGFLQYRLEGRTITLIHTEVDPDYEGHGVAGTLARTALDDARARALTVRPLCPYVKRWLQRHPDYTDVVA